jgi:hypothetical protein
MEKLGAKVNTRISQSEALRKSIKADELLLAFSQFVEAQESFSAAAATNIEVEASQFPFKYIEPKNMTTPQKQAVKTKLLKNMTNNEKEALKNKSLEKIIDTLHASTIHSTQAERELSQKRLKEAKALVDLTTNILMDKLKQYKPFVEGQYKVIFDGFIAKLRSYNTHVLPYLIFPPYSSLKPNTYTWRFGRQTKNGVVSYKNIGNLRANVAARKTRRRELGNNTPLNHISLQDLKNVLRQTLPPAQARTITRENEVEGVGSLFNENAATGSAATSTKPCNKKEGCVVMGGKRKTRKQRN